MSLDLISTTEFTNVAFQDFLHSDLDSSDVEDGSIIGGIFSDAKHTWQAKGSCLEVRNIHTTHKLGSWRFGANIQESSIRITAVEELKRSKGPLPLLVIALNCSVNQGIISIFDIFGSKVLRTVEIKEQITSLHVIDSDGDKCVLDSSPLTYFDGIVAVGTHGGRVLLLDICKELCESVMENMDVSVRDELNPCSMVILTKAEVRDIKKYVERSVEHEEHLAIHLNDVADNSTKHFILKGENGDDRVHVDRTELEVSSLFYSARIASLLVGYNFGAFQAWDLRSLNLMYTSPICEGNIPITHFTFQEPADDPKAYCYIWVSYSHDRLFRPGLPFAVLYSFLFGKKMFLKGCGNIYENFHNCSIRFQLELGDTQSSTCSSPVKGGLCLGFRSFNKCISNKDQHSVALCVISWLFWDANKEVNTAFLLFELNQWYKEQMPRVPSWSNCSNYLIKNNIGDRLFDIKIDQKSLVQFMGLQRLEQHFCPTALSFDLWGITENAVLKLHSKSIQRLFLDKIADSQHLALLRPDHFSEQIFTLGLTPLFCDYPTLNSSQLEDQRELLLSVALEQRLVGWLCQAATKLANNAFSSSGLTICNILNWAFHRAIVLKNSLCQYCVPLFDYSGARLDDNTLTMLLAGTNQMRNLCSLYRYVSNKLIQFVVDGKQLLEEQRSLEHLVTYFEVVLWMTNVGLLPECQPHGPILFNMVSAPYLIDKLRDYYSNKREQLQLASKETFVEKDCLLFIDNMINNQTECELIRQQWQEDGGTGLYPPPSLQSVLRIYLLDGLDVTFKHSFVTYTLLDIAMTVDEHHKILKLLLKFPQIFNLSQSTIKIVQAFWHLDHDDYETALESILDPSVLLEDLQPWHHSSMMRALLTQNQPGLALLYLQIRKPPIQQEKDLLTVVSLLISKNMLDEAFKFRDQHKGTTDETALLTHIFNECNKNELLHTLLYRRLNTDEEKVFFKYLQGNRNPKYEDLQVFYYLLKSRFLEAFDSYSILKRRLPSAQGLVGQRDATTTDNVMKMFKNLLPDVNRSLVETVRKERTNLWKEVPRPTPFSVFVHNPKDQMHYKSSIIFAALSKAKQTFNDAADRTGVETELTPFLRTPRMFTRKSVQNTPVLKCRVVEQKETGEDYGPSPCKKFKLSPRAPMATPMKKKSEMFNSVQSNFHTPIVKRKRSSCDNANTPANLPQSILKTRTFLEDSLMNENSSTNAALRLECESSITKARFALTPRKAIGTPLKSRVKFDDLHYSTISEDRKEKSSSPQDDGQTSLQGTSAINSVDTNDFCYPGLTLEDQENLVAGKCSTPLVKSKTSTKRDQKVFRQLPEVTDIAGKANIPLEKDDLTTNRLNFQSPKARRSYKRSLGENVVPIRSSPRLAQKKSSESTQETSTTSPVKLVRAASLKPRKSLSRSVLEQNAFSKLNDEESIPEVIPNYNEKSGNFSFSSISSEPTVYLDDNDSFRGSNLCFDEDSNNADASFTSKTTEVRSMEVSRTNMQCSKTGELIEHNESRKYVSKTIEIFTDEEVELNKVELQEDENQTGLVTINEEANFTVAESIGDISTEEQDNSLKDDTVKVYEDLSSGSEDIIQAIHDIEDGKAANEQSDRLSTSTHYTEHEIQGISADSLAPVHYDPILTSNDGFQGSPHKQSFVNQSSIIEIASSSEDELNSGLLLESADESNFRLHICWSPNRSSVADNETEKSEAIFNEENSSTSTVRRSGSDFEPNEETHSAEEYGRAPICIDSSRESHEDCPEAVVQLHAHPENQPDLMIEASNRQITPSPTAEVTSVKEATKILEKGTDEENSVYGSSNNLDTDIEMSELAVGEADNISTDSNKRSISIQCTLPLASLASNNSDDSEGGVELSEHQRSIYVQCTLPGGNKAVEQSAKVEEGSPELAVRTVTKTYISHQALVDATPKFAAKLARRTYSKKTIPRSNLEVSKAQETVNSLSSPDEMQRPTSEDQVSFSGQDIVVNDGPANDDKSDEEIIKDEISTPDLILRTVKKSYKGPQSRLDATPQLAVHLTTRKYLRKTKIQLLDDSNAEKSNDQDNSSQENQVTEESDNEKLHEAEIVINIAKSVEPTTAKPSGDTRKLSILTEKMHSKNIDGSKCSENDQFITKPGNSDGVFLVHIDDKDVKTTFNNDNVNDNVMQTCDAISNPKMSADVNAVPLKKKLSRKQPGSISGNETKAESKTDKSTPRTRKRSTRPSQDESVVSSTSEGSGVSERIMTRSTSLRSEEARTEEPVNVSPPKIRRTRRLISDDNMDKVADLADSQESDTKKAPKRKSTVAAERPKTTKKKNTTDLTEIDDIRLITQNTRRSTRSRSEDLEPMATVQVVSSVDQSERAGKGKSKAASQISTYSMSRRVTRRQANLLQSMSGVQDKIDIELPIMEDPVELLDKPEFKGKRDPDEAKVYERSPSIASDTSRQTEANSVISDSQVVTPPKLSGTKKGAKSKKSKKQIELVTPKTSEDMAEVGQNTVKRTGLRQRARTNSVSSIQSDISDMSNSSVRTTRSRSSRTVKTPLPEISEDKNEDGPTTLPAKPAKKVGRKNTE